MLRAGAWYLIAAGVCLASGATLAADPPPLIGKAPAQNCVQAVDGINGQLAGFGGTFGGQQYDGGMGALSIPLGCEFGAQIDGDAAGFDGRFLGTVAGHLFWRNPAKGLLGAYGDFTQWNQFGGVRAAHLGPEGEWYNGYLTVAGVAGVEFGNSQSGTAGTVVQTFSVPTRFFDQINLAYYPLDNLQVYAGHRYLDGRNALALGSEWGMPMGHGIMSALFVEGRVGDGAYHGIWGGVRVYFGRTDKTLIRRHREDDPTNWNDGAASTFNGGSQTSGSNNNGGGGGGGGGGPICPPHC